MFVSFQRTHFIWFRDYEIRTWSERERERERESKRGFCVKFEYANLSCIRVIRYKTL